jgi:UDPglucose 6-dehydrogenase
VTDLAVAGADAIFLAVGTPVRRGNGRADLQFVFEAVEAIAVRLQSPTVVICKSTVPVGTNRRVLARLRELQPDVAVEVASNPEFFR